MKSETGKYFAVLLMLVLLPACAPSNQHIAVHEIDVLTTASARINGNHTSYNALADQHERLAQMMQTKAKEQEEKLKRLSNSIYFSKNKWSKKTQAAYKFRKYQRVAEENLEIGAYYRKLSAEQSARKSILKIKQTDAQKNMGLPQITGASYHYEAPQESLK